MRTIKYNDIDELIYNYICNNIKQISPTYEDIAFEFDISTNTVQRALQRLRMCGKLDDNRLPK